MASASQAPANRSPPGPATDAAASRRPYVLHVASDRPPGSAGSGSSSSGGGPHGRDPIQALCPYTGSNVTSARPLRTPAPSNKNGSFGVRCLVPVPLRNMMGGGGDVVDATLFVGHGGAGGTSKAVARGGGKDDHAFLLGGQLSTTSGGGSSGGTNPRWKVRLPETLTSTPQSMAVSPDGRYLAAGSISGTCYLWDWTCPGRDNLVKVWKAHYRPVTCLAFDKDDGATLFTAGEDGVVNAWCLIDLVDRDGPASVHPFRTWSEHQLPVTSLCVFPGSGPGSTRLASSSLDRNLIIMELGGSSSGKSLDGSGRTLARMCLPSGLHTVITDSSCARLYAGGSDGNVYCIDMCRHAIQETLDGAGTLVNVNQSGDAFFSENRGLSDGAVAAGDFESLLSGSHVLPSTAATAADQSNYVSELKGHVKAVTCLALMDPADLVSSSNGGGAALLASGSEDGTLRIWDLRSRSCVKVLRPWSPSSEGASIASASSASSSPPVAAVIAVPTSSSASYGGTLAIPAASSATNSGRRGSARGDPASLFQPLKRFVRGTSVVAHEGTDAESLSGECAVTIWPRRDEAFVRFWEDAISVGDDVTRPRKKAKSANGKANAGDTASDKVEIARLREALAEAEAKNERWQAVNNQLVSKLKSK